MNTVLHPTRRQLIRTPALGLLAGSLGAGTVASASAMRQWQPADGLRLVGSTSGLASLDPAISRDLVTNFLLRQVFRGLVSLDANLEPQPELAESVEQSADGQQYTFTLRPEARFHDGRAVTAEDVLHAFSRALNPATTGGFVEGLAAITYLGDIAGAEDVLAGASETLSGIEVVDERTVIISLVRPSPTFLIRLTSITASIVDKDQTGATPNGSGPFRVSDWRAEEFLALESSEHWWEGQPRLGSVDVRLGLSASQPLNLFQAGDIDLVTNVPADLVDLIVDPASGVAYGELLESETFATAFISLGNAVAPLDDIHVRKALQLVFSSERVAGASFNGGVIPAQGLVPPGMLGVPWDVRRADVDVEAARAELAQSRYGSGPDVPPISIFGADIDQVETLREVALEALGLTIEAIQIDWPEFLEGLSERRFPAYTLYWGADYPDPEAMIGMLFGADSPDNYNGYVNPELEDLLEAGRSTEGEERIGIFQQANQLLIDDAALIPIYHPRGFALVAQGVTGITLTPMGVLDLEGTGGVS